MLVCGFVCVLIRHLDDEDSGLNDNVRLHSCTEGGDSWTGRRRRRLSVAIMPVCWVSGTSSCERDAATIAGLGIESSSDTESESNEDGASTSESRPVSDLAPEACADFCVARCCSSQAVRILIDHSVARGSGCVCFHTYPRS